MNFRYLEGPDDAGFGDVLRIYHAAFPVAAREPDERLAQELRGEYRLPFRFLVVEDPAVIAFARFCRVPGEDFGFLIHIAADADRRGKGVGTELLRRVILDGGPLVAEIDREGSVRRWYERQGFVTISECYTQPSLRPETPPLPFALLRSPDEAFRIEPAEMVRRFYRSVWELPEEHPFVQEALRGVPA